jgi:large subunit ribosomal protein L24
MKIKKGDNVIVISGSKSDKGKTGKVLEIFKDKDQVIVEGINIKKKITRDPQGNKKEVKVEYPVHNSNVMFFDAKEKKGTKLGYKVDEKGNKVRVAKASGTELK